MISADHEGRTYPPTKAFLLSRAAIEEFATALGDSDANYINDHPVAPPTMLAMIWTTAWQSMFADPELALVLSRTLHATQRFTWNRNLRERDEIRGQLRIVGVEPRGHFIKIDFVVQFSTITGEPVATSESSFYYEPEVAA